MKFTDGFWRNREGIEVYNSCRVYDLEIDETSITAFAPFFDVSNRGQTLTGPLLSYRFSSPMENVIRVQMWHYSGQKRRGPDFSVASPSPGFKALIAENDECATLKSGALSMRLSKGKAWSLDFFDGERPLTNSRWRNSGYATMPDGSAYMKEELGLGVGECVYGLGERFTSFVKNGQVVDSWNADGGTSSELSYKNIPFYLTNKGYGVFVADPGLVSFEVASEKVARVQFSVRGECLEYYVINGPDPKGVLRRYTALTGRPSLPPAWSFGLWLTTSFVTEYDEKTVSSFVDGMAERGIPLSVFHFDCFWMREYHWTDFAWNERYFPDPQGFLARLKARGLKICVWINPYIAQRSKLFAEGAEKGYLLKRPDGGVWQTDAWQPGMGMVDFTNPGAREWFAAKIRGLVDMGVDCLKTDFGERIPTNVAWFDGSDPERMHNYYSYAYNEVSFGALEEKLGKGNSLVFARSATAGGQKFPVHWGGDCTASYESMAESLRGGLSLCLSGFGFWSHDISGFEHTATPDLYKRWAAFGLLSSHSRLHGNGSYRVPWLFDQEAVDVLRHFTKFKCSLMPYLFGAAVRARDEGLPMMRAMVLEYPDDRACAYLDRQYFLGDSLLVAPVLSETGEVEYYLPAGGWTNLLSGERVAGGRWVKERHGYMGLPLMARDGSMIAFGSHEDKPDYDYAQGVRIELFPLADGQEASTTVYSPEGAAELSLKAERKGNEIRLSAAGTGKPWTISLRGATALKAEGMDLRKDGPATILSPKRPTGAYAIALAADEERERT
jgi:alpha-D-xyloside xylohydrolase